MYFFAVIVVDTAVAVVFVVIVVDSVVLLVDVVVVVVVVVIVVLLVAVVVLATLFTSLHLSANFLKVLQLLLQELPALSQGLHVLVFLYRRLHNGSIFFFLQKVF